MYGLGFRVSSLPPMQFKDNPEVGYTYKASGVALMGCGLNGVWYHQRGSTVAIPVFHIYAGAGICGALSTPSLECHSTLLLPHRWIF